VASRCIADNVCTMVFSIHEKDFQAVTINSKSAFLYSGGRAMVAVNHSRSCGRMFTVCKRG
jgi:predicted aconitase